MVKPQLIITHENRATLEEAFHIVEKLDWGFCVVEGGKFVITMTTQKDSKKEESMVTWSGKVEGGQKRDQFWPFPSVLAK